MLGNLSALWKTDLDGKVLGAVEDTLSPRLERRDPELDKVPRVARYFNAGVLLIDLERWRKEYVTERALHYLEMHPSSPMLIKMRSTLRATSAGSPWPCVGTSLIITG